jgi:ketosteroid isomerase-like protein
MKIVVVGLVVLSGTVAGVGAQKAAPAAKPATADPAIAARTAIERADAAYAAAVKRGDAAAVAANYSADAIRMDSNEPAWRGIAAITAGFADDFKNTTYTVFDLKIESVIAAGDLAIETGSAQLAWKPKTGGPEVKDTEKYLTVWKHQADGSWKVIRVIWNSDLPAGK